MVEESKDEMIQNSEMSLIGLIFVFLLFITEKFTSV